MQPIGIRREDKNPFERRVPLIPEHIAELTSQHELQITVQPSARRVFADEAYREAGAKLSESLDTCSIILGVKEIPLERLAAKTTYVFFSHTIKGQPYNMPLLRRLLELGCTLLDYERIVDDQDRRLVFFGRHAGLAGMIDTLWALGQRLAEEGIATPFARLEQAHSYPTLAIAKAAVRQVGETLAAQGLPPALEPLVFGITGYGNVSQGAQEVLDLLQPRVLEPPALAERSPRAGLYKVVFYEEHLVEPQDGAFVLQDYYDHPERYRSIFDRYLERLTALVNCIYWEPRYPRLVQNTQLAKLFATGQPRLRVIGDISCDVQGSIEATLRATEPDNPVFVYDVQTGQGRDGVAGTGPVIMAVDNLPAELPVDASEAFSSALLPFVPALAQAKLDAPLDRCGLPPELARAVVVYQGELAPDYRYLSKFL